MLNTPSSRRCTKVTSSLQRREEATEQRRQSKIQPITGSAPSVSQEGVREHTYELLQDYTINMGGWSKRVRICQHYHGRIFVDHAEIDISGVSYTVPSGILSAPKDRASEISLINLDISLRSFGQSFLLSISPRQWGCPHLHGSNSSPRSKS